MDTRSDAGAVAPWLARLGGRALRCSAGCRGATVVLRFPGGESHSAVTHPDLAALAASQEETGEGPGIEAARSGLPVCAADLVTDVRWPEFRVAALERGLRACTAVPATAEGVMTTVTLYAFRPWRLAAEALEVVRMLAEESAVGLLRDHARTNAEAEAEQLRTAITSRAVIDQALGIVMHMLDCDADRAFGVLRTLSQHTNRKLSAVAAGIVESKGRGSTRELRRVLGEGA
ncbi:MULTISPECIES: GAF and ANTAR domain-containing protein [unclassified Streptomyces]|uniref:GAF and ANTAR domain-containing protein n=2 Tax=Streptomyces TaxID=1883 RepID=UPI00224D48AB|nr:GAF and ANTAR domain-containing protein [Streptomyces sp. NBC_01789]MCX4445342.1 GAF and ANTAR domain-containing protein [Streptomyces sp. NBC_01789]